MNFFVLLLLASLAVASAWTPARWRHRAVALSIGLLVVAGWRVGAMTPTALLWVAALFASAWCAARSGVVKRLGWILFIFFALGIGFGLLPGFNPIVLSPAPALKPESLPFTLQVGLGKPLVAVALLLWLVPVSEEANAWKASLRTAVLLTFMTAGIVLPLAWALHYVRPSLGLPAMLPMFSWMAINLLLVCAVEEGFFRGVVQRGLATKIPSGSAIAVAAALFGLAHFAGGWPYMLVATIAGVGYGLAYELSGQRIEAAMLAHFGVNLAHLSLFTYPAAA